MTFNKCLNLLRNMLKLTIKYGQVARITIKIFINKIVSSIYKKVPSIPLKNAMSI